LKIVRKIFEPKRDKVAGGSRRLHDEKLHKFFCSHTVWVIKSRIMMGVNVGRIGQMKNIYNMLVGKPEGTRPLRRP